eukprot:gene22823-31119_t
MSGYISLFHIKCSIITIFGVEIKTKELREICEVLLPRNSLRGSQCRDNGYNFFEFTEILEYVRDNFVRENDHLEVLYKSLDQNNKGWVDKEDFSKSVAKIAPNFSKTHSARIFDLLDSNNTKVILKSQWLRILGEGSQS